MQHREVNLKQGKETSIFSEYTVIPNLRPNYAQGELLQETFSFRATISLYPIWL